MGSSREGREAFRAGRSIEAMLGARCLGARCSVLRRRVQQPRSFFFSARLFPVRSQEVLSGDLSGDTRGPIEGWWGDEYE